MYRPLVIACLLSGLAQPAVAPASEYAGLGRLAYAGLPRDQAPVRFPANAAAAGPLGPFLRLDGEPDTGSLDSLAAGLRMDGGDWRLKGELQARPLAEGLEPTLRLDSSWRLGEAWQLSGRLASRPLDQVPAVSAGSLRLAARRTGPGGAWDEFSLQRQAEAGGWSEHLALAAHRRVLAHATEELSVTGRITSREAVDAQEQAFFVSFDHRWEAWTHARLRIEQNVRLGVGGHHSDTRIQPARTLRYGHLWALGNRLDLEYAIEQGSLPGGARADDETRLSLGVTGRF